LVGLAGPTMPPAGVAPSMPPHWSVGSGQETTSKPSPPLIQSRCMIKGQKEASHGLLTHHLVCHYYRLIYHCHHFHYRSNRCDRVVLPPSIGMIVRPLGNETGSLDFNHRRVNVRCGSGIGVAFAPSHEKPGWLGYAFCPVALN
jgi:hypothetical protein